jgi:putative nucleotidyltransferase with HDIG domain
MTENKIANFLKLNPLLFLLKALRNLHFWLILFSSLFLAALFYFHDIPIENVKVGSISSRFIVAQTDFEHIDHVATRVLKNQAKYQLGSIFKLDERAVLLQLNNIYRSLNETAQQTQIELDQFVEKILNARFTDTKTIRKIGEAQLDLPQEFYEYSYLAGGVSEQFWLYLTPKKSSEILLKLISRLEKIPFILAPDLDLESKIHEELVQAVPAIKATFKAGQLLLSPGDKIQDFHKDLLISMKEAQKNTKTAFSLLNASASLVLGILFTLLYGFYLVKNHSDIAYNFSKLLLLALLIILGIGGAKCLEIIIINSGLVYLDGLRYTPILALSVLLISLVLDRHVAILSLMLMLVMTYLFLAFEPERFLLINFMASSCILLFTSRINRRRQIFTAVLQTYGILLPAFCAFHIYDKNLLSISIVYDLIANLSFIIVGCLFILLLLPFIERWFSITTNMMLTEYLDPNHELLRRLTLEAPGTYQHSLLVGHLAENAARSIGVNDLFCRVAALYHDIGKIYNPQYFTENQLGGFNIHRLLSPKESAQIIISHVAEGEKLARKYRLPESFIDIMKEHHGTTLVYYFYKKELENHQNDKSLVAESDFRYKGPKPKSKESAILMIADCVEASSRSLENSSEHEITKLVDKIVKERLFDGQLDESCLTFNELKKVKKAIVKALMVTHHVRVIYPHHELNVGTLV